MKKLLTLAVLAAVAASCTQSEVEDVKQSNEYIGIASATVNNMALTRAGEGSPLNQGSLGLFVTTEGDDIFKVDNMRWNYGERQRRYMIYIGVGLQRCSFRFDGQCEKPLERGTSNSTESPRLFCICTVQRVVTEKEQRPHHGETEKP